MCTIILIILTAKGQKVEFLVQGHRAGHGVESDLGQFDYDRILCALAVNIYSETPPEYP